MTARVTESLAGSSPWRPRAARIVDIRAEASGVATYDLQLEEPAEWVEFLPGQFNMLYVPGFGEAAISISSDPSRTDMFSHTVRVAGNVTRALGRMRPGRQIGVRGPFGSHWPLEECRHKDVVIACGGIGIAPLRPAIYRLLSRRDEYRRLILLYGARTPNDLVFTSEFAAWRDQGMEVEVTVDIGDDQWQGHVGVAPVLFYRLRLSPNQATVLACGPEIMMRFVVFEALARRVRPEDIYVSMERNMACGMGLCGHCQLGPYFVCKEGPVFSFQQIEPYFSVEEL